jgi:hypothetical protein
MKAINGQNIGFSIPIPFCARRGGWPDALRLRLLRTVIRHGAKSSDREVMMQVQLLPNKGAAQGREAMFIRAQSADNCSNGEMFGRGNGDDSVSKNYLG